MKIIFDHDYSQSGELVAVHYIETTPGAFPQFTHPKLAPSPVDVIHIIHGMHGGYLPTAGTGWDQITNHPDHTGKTRLQVVIDEIVKNDDKEARAILGV